jgi:hypothetical protein
MFSGDVDGSQCWIGCLDANYKFAVLQVCSLRVDGSQCWIRCTSYKFTVCSLRVYWVTNYNFTVLQVCSLLVYAWVVCLSYGRMYLSGVWLAGEVRRWGTSVLVRVSGVWLVNDGSCQGRVWLAHVRGVTGLWWLMSGVWLVYDGSCQVCN